MAKKDKDKNPVGRPRKFKSAEAMQEAIAAYFKECDDNKSTFVTKDGLVMKVPDPMPYNVVGLALAIGLSRKQLLEYEHDYEDEFRNTVKIAKLKVEKAAADFTFRAKNPTGGIFNLKCNYGWQDKQVIEHQGEVAHNVHVIELPKKDGGKD